MFTAFIIGNIASGKSFASKYLEGKGAFRIDLDQMSKDLYVPGSQIVSDIAEEFGYDVLAPDGGILTSALAKKAFSDPDRASRLNAIVHPALLHQLSLRLLPPQCCTVLVPEHALTIVEVSVAASFTDAFGLADEVIAVTAPLEIRRQRAISRGMSAEDFDDRAACQPSEEELCSLATFVIDNTHIDGTLERSLDDWLSSCGLLCASGASHE